MTKSIDMPAADLEHTDSILFNENAPQVSNYRCYFILLLLIHSYLMLVDHLVEQVFGKNHKEIY